MSSVTNLQILSASVRSLCLCGDLTLKNEINHRGTENFTEAQRKTIHFKLPKTFEPV